MQQGIQEIKQMLRKNKFRCPICLNTLAMHSSYMRSIKETGEQIEIVVARCKKRCGKGTALLPDFISPKKQYSIRAIEAVMHELQERRVSEIETEASESTIYRWKTQLTPRITTAISVIKAIYIEMKAAVSELLLDEGGGFKELESLLDEAPKRLRHSGTTLGLSNLWLGIRSPPLYI
jgi:hypothetical protein